PATDREWFGYWRNFCKEFLLNLGMKEENLRLRDREKKNYHSTHKLQQTLNIYSHLDGENYGELPIELIMICQNIVKVLEKS
ncbi:MAG: hypothetical protein E7J43_06540, partial [Finegoldia magna]|nr:hypothetical protein [Finegoldia magna]